MFEKHTGEIIDRNVYSQPLDTIIVVSYILLGGVLLIMGFLTEVGIIGVIVGLWFLVYDYFLISKVFAKYEFKKEGILARYPFSLPQLISWDKFQQICICYTSYSKLRDAYVVIACVKHGEKKNLYGRWKTDNTFRHRKVITIDYIEEIYKELQSKCPYEIVDLRMNRSYKLR